MRVLHLVTRLNIGGITRHLAAFLPHLECEFLLAAGVCVDEPEESVPFDVIRLPHLVRPVHPVKDVLAFWEILSLLRRVRPDILHTHMAKAGWLGRIAAKVLGIPCVHTYHGNIFAGHFNRLTTVFLRALERATVPLLNGAVYVSPSCMEALIREVGSPRCVCVIVPAFDAGGLRNRKQAVGDFPQVGTQNQVVVGWLGRMVKVKRPELAVSAVAEVDGCRLVMAGDGEARPATEKLAAEIAREKVEFLGWVSQEKIWDFLKRVDLFLMTSVAEGFVLSLVNALHAGVPVVAVEAQGVVDVMGTDAGDGIKFCDAGIVCKEELLAEALRQAIERLDEMKSRVSAAWERVWRMVNPKAVAEAHLRFYQQVLGGRRDG